MLTIEIVSINKKIAVPYKKGQSIEQLIKEIIKRALLTVDVTSEYQLYHNSSELYHEDTLEDLGINDNDLLQLKQSQQPVVGDDNQQQPPQQQQSTTTTIADNISEKLSNVNISTTTTSSTSTTSSEITKDSDNNNNNNNNNNYKQEIKQIDMIVLDLSGSMRSAAFKGSLTPGELEMKRIEIAQALFQTMIDKYVQLEIAAIVGLVCFGERIEVTFPPTRNFDSFSTELGEVVANQSKTRLYEAIKLAGETIVKYRENPTSLADGFVLAPSDKLICRVFALTDGQDNSNACPYEVYKYLKSANIILDAIPIGEGGNTLGSFTKATGGSCFTFNSSKAGVELFEREAVVNLSTRDNLAAFSIPINSKAAFSAIAPEIVTTVEQKADATIKSAGKCSSNVAVASLESNPVSLLQSPNPMDPIDPVKAGLYRDNPTEYWNNARLWNKNYASFTLTELKQLHSLE
ncbi:hypothetical protein PPL_02583 [Heterostelium album PN500]|uniref:VWFA domain-containing protein n=1 Tax=Heterostelium pallidum (strain ATCC 26659 / Pp 5 / PN500) TaxID=670386 RepID=D3B2H0_HETP5|nr:hypothetical protein PPL_02583 [Heterostelium album PN500]EFA83518.1 hypothetical protein PPL_02583 [Heterostelium album PN500]|eukprot:XP_020435635.1 hypothetical protein PPL_02583 [Heterostelium album PN500]